MLIVNMRARNHVFPIYHVRVFSSTFLSVEMCFPSENIIMYEISWKIWSDLSWRDVILFYHSSVFVLHTPGSFSLLGCRLNPCLDSSASLALTVTTCRNDYERAERSYVEWVLFVGNAFKKRIRRKDGEELLKEGMRLFSLITFALSESRGLAKQEVVLEFECAHDDSKFNVLWWFKAS